MVPKATHLQFLILSILAARQRSGAYIRGQLTKERVRMSGPAFYQLMSRLESAGLVEGRYEEGEVDGVRVRERWYKITEPGRKKRTEIIAFYSRMGRVAVVA